MRVQLASEAPAAFGTMKSTGPLSLIPPKRILIAEDDLVSAHYLRLALTVDGHAVDSVADGHQALEAFGSKPYDLVITDFRLPGLDGLEVAEAIKQLSPSTPILLITAYPQSVQSPIGEVSNVDALLNKPVSVAKLQETLNRVFLADISDTGTVKPSV